MKKLNRYNLFIYCALKTIVLLYTTKSQSQECFVNKLPIDIKKYIFQIIIDDTDVQLKTIANTSAVQKEWSTIVRDILHTICIVDPDNCQQFTHLDQIYSKKIVISQEWARLLEWTLLKNHIITLKILTKLELQKLDDSQINIIISHLVRAIARKQYQYAYVLINSILIYVATNGNPVLCSNAKILYEIKKIISSMLSSLLSQSDLELENLVDKVITSRFGPAYIRSILMAEHAEESFCNPYDLIQKNNKKEPFQKWWSIIKKLSLS